MAPVSLCFLRGVHVGLFREGSGWALRFGPNGGGPARALIALDEAGRVLGCIAYDVRSGRRFVSFLTYVARRARGLGLASSLWALALGAARARKVEVRVISDNGLTLVRKVAAEHPGVRFLIREDGERKLRDKRRKGLA
jgi:GNAT superfamily N-acetyltransferase